MPIQPYGSGAPGIYDPKTGAPAMARDTRATAYGRDTAWNPELQRGRALSGGFGQQYGGAFGMQRDMYNRFGQMAAGAGPSLAQGQLQAGMADAGRAATQQMLQARGGNAAGAQMAATGMQANMGGQAAVAAANLRQQEMLGAMSAQAGMANQMAGQSLQGQLGMEGMYQGALQSQLEANLGGRQQRLDERNARIERAQGIKGMILPDLSDMRSKTDIQPTQTGAQTAGGILGMLGGKAAALGPLIALSDERAKQNVAPTSASEVVGNLDAASYEYKPGFGQEPGRNLGVMAQDLGAAYPPAVGQGPDGLQYIDMAKAGALTLAATVEQEKRLRALEQMLGGGAFGGAAQQGSSLGYRAHGTAEGF